MELWEWLLLGAVAAGIVALAIHRFLRATRPGRRFLSLSAESKLRFGRYVLAKGDLPLPIRIVMIGTVGYLALPLDIIPDFIPIIGHLDDFLVTSVAVLLLMSAIPAETFDRALRDAEEFSHRKRLERAQDVSQSTSP